MAEREGVFLLTDLRKLCSGRIEKMWWRGVFLPADLKSGVFLLKDLRKICSGRIEKWGGGISASAFPDYRFVSSTDFV